MRCCEMLSLCLSECLVRVIDNHLDLTCVLGSRCGVLREVLVTEG